MPSMTVLMPVYNGERHLRAAIDSILAQTYDDFELLIVNDGSTDTSRTIITSYTDKRIRLVDHGENLGLTRTLNRGLSLSAGELVARQDADDISHPERLTRQMAVLRDDPQVALVGARGLIIDEGGQSRGLSLTDQHGNFRGLVDVACEDTSVRWDLLFGNCFIHSAVMFRKKVVWEELGGYDESFLLCEDYELWSRVAFAGRVRNVSDRLVSYRIHPSAKTADNRCESLKAEVCRVIRRSIHAMFGERVLSDGEIDLIARFTVGFDEEGLVQFLSLFKRLLERYQGLFPETARSYDFRQTIARRYAKLAYKALSANPKMARHLLGQGIFDYPVLAVSLPWMITLAPPLISRAVRKLGGRLFHSTGG